MWNQSALYTLWRVYRALCNLHLSLPGIFVVRRRLLLVRLFNSLLCSSRYRFSIDQPKRDNRVIYIEYIWVLVFVPASFMVSDSNFKLTTLWNFVIELYRKDLANWRMSKFFFHSPSEEASQIFQLFFQHSNGVNVDDSNRYMNTIEGLLRRISLSQKTCISLVLSNGVLSQWLLMSSSVLTIQGALR